MMQFLTPIESNNVTNASSELLEIAERELYETEKVRSDGLELFRDWILNSSQIQICRFDNKFLLRFLRTKKFNINEAQVSLEKYLSFRQTFPNAFHNLSLKLQPQLNKLVDLGIVFPLMNRDKFGRRIIFIRGGMFDPRQFNVINILQISALTIDTLTENEQDQICGFTYLIDGSGFGIKHFTMASPRIVLRVLKNAEKILPMRHKEIHIFNVPILLRIVFDFILGFLPSKFKSRFYFHKTFRDFQKRNIVDSSILPKEYSGNIPIVDFIDLWKNEIRIYEQLVLLNDQMLIRLH